MGESADGVVDVSTALRAEAQDDAIKTYGFDDDHTSILDDPAVSRVLNTLISEER